MYAAHYGEGSAMSSSGDKVKHKSGTPYSSPYKKDMYDKLFAEKPASTTGTRPLADSEGMQGKSPTQTQDKSQKVMVSGNDGKKDYGKGNPHKSKVRTIQQLRDLAHKLA